MTRPSTTLHKFGKTLRSSALRQLLQRGEPAQRTGLTLRASAFKNTSYQT